MNCKDSIDTFFWTQPHVPLSDFASHSLKNLYSCLQLNLKKPADDQQSWIVGIRSTHFFGWLNQCEIIGCTSAGARALPTRGYPHVGWAPPTRFRLKVPLPTWVRAWDWILRSHSISDRVGKFIVVFMMKNHARAWKRCFLSIRCTKLLHDVCNPNVRG